MNELFEERQANNPVPSRFSNRIICDPLASVGIINGAVLQNKYIHFQCEMFQESFYSDTVYLHARFWGWTLFNWKDAHKFSSVNE